MARSDEVLSRTIPITTMPFEAFEAQSDYLLEEFDKLHVLRHEMFMDDPERTYERIYVQPRHRSCHIQPMVQLKLDGAEDGESSYITWNGAGQDIFMMCYHKPAGPCPYDPVYQNSFLNPVRRREPSSTRHPQPIHIPIFIGPQVAEYLSMSQREAASVAESTYRTITWTPTYFPDRGVIDWSMEYESTTHHYVMPMETFIRTPDARLMLILRDHTADLLNPSRENR